MTTLLNDTGLRNNILESSDATRGAICRVEEMVPCALLHVENSGCKASWETRHATKDDPGQNREREREGKSLEERDAVRDRSLCVIGRN